MLYLLFLASVPKNLTFFFSLAFLLQAFHWYSPLFKMHAFKARGPRDIFIHVLDRVKFCLHTMECVSRGGGKEFAYRELWRCFLKGNRMAPEHAHTHTCTQTHIQTSSIIYKGGACVRMPGLCPASGTGLSSCCLWASLCGLLYTECLIVKAVLKCRYTRRRGDNIYRTMGSINWQGMAVLHGGVTWEK